MHLDLTGYPVDESPIDLSKVTKVTIPKRGLWVVFIVGMVIGAFTGIAGFMAALH